jgi:Gig2-like
VIDYADIEAGTVSPEASAMLHRRGCLVVRGHFDRAQALGWDRAIVDYVEGNRFFENYRGPGDDFFGSVGSKPEIYPIYWSPPQMRARQSERMATVQRFLNSQWKHESDGVRWFDPHRDSLYPDRIRRRPEGADSAGLGTHLDPGTLDLWMTEAYQKAFRHLFDGTIEQ